MHRKKMNPQAGRIALGTVQFGLDYGINNHSGIVENSMVKTMLDEAIRVGINTMDTARVYGNSELILGNFDLSPWLVVSKFTITPGQSVITAFEESIKALNINRLYGYLAHNAEELVSHPEAWGELQTLKEKGKIEKIGYSLYLPEQLEVLLRKGMQPDLVQVQYNLFDRRFEPYFGQLKEHGVEIHTRSCFLQGLFFMDEEIHSYFKPLKNSLDSLRRLFPEKEKRAAALLQFCLDNPYIDKVVIGLRSNEELNKNLSALALVAPGCLSDFVLPECDNNILLPYNWPERKKS